MSKAVDARGCIGEGTITTQLSFMPSIVEVLLPDSKGARAATWTRSRSDIWARTALKFASTVELEESVEFFEDQPAIPLAEVGSWMSLGLGLPHAGPSVDGTFSPVARPLRVKLMRRELAKLKRGKQNLYILDEPTTGLHLADIDRAAGAVSESAG